VYLDSRKYSFDAKVNRAKPVNLPKKAVPASKALFTAQTLQSQKGVSRTKRIYNEFKKCAESSNLPQIQLFMNEDDFNFWKIVLKGETGTLYAGGHWLLYVQFINSYPINPPEIRFATPIFHCNINSDGKICHEIITTKWSPSTQMETVFSHIIDLLKEPNADDALDVAKGALLRDNKDEYENQARAFVVKHSRNLQQLKDEFSLIDLKP